MEIGKAESSGRVPYQGSSAAPAVTSARPEAATVPETGPQPVMSAPQPVMTQNAAQNQQGGQDAAQGTRQDPRTAEREEKRAGKNNAQLKSAVSEMNRQMKESEAVFGIHEKTNRVTIKIVDKTTKEVIKEYPPEQTLDMIAKVWEVAGILVDEKM